MERRMEATRGTGRRNLFSWMSRIMVTILAITAGAVVMQQPAAAHTQNICTSIVTGAVNTLSQGAIRQLPSHGHNHNIRFSTSSAHGCASNFPSGGSVNVRVRFIQKSSSGGCTTTNIGDGSLVVFTGAQTQTLATNVLPGTCYRIIWRPTNSAAAHKTIPVTLRLVQS